MKTKPDGIRVSLKPKGAGSISREFREIPWNTAKHNSHYAEAMIQKFGGRFNVILHLPESFEVPVGYALLAEVSMQALSRRGVFGTLRCLVSRFNYETGLISITGADMTTSGFKNRMMLSSCYRLYADVRKVRNALRTPFSKIEAEPGTIKVSVTIVRVVWNDGLTRYSFDSIVMDMTVSLKLYSRFGPRGPRFRRHYKDDDCLIRPDGALGETQTFVFRPEAKGKKASIGPPCGLCLLRHSRL